MIRRTILTAAALLACSLFTSGRVARADSWQMWVHTPEGIAKFHTDRVDSVTFEFGDFTRPALAFLTLFNSTNTSIDVEWTATGDDSLTGTATAYDLRYSTDPATPFASMTQATGEPAPLSPGTTQNFTVTGLLSGTEYWFVLQVADEAGNASLSSARSFFTAGTPPIWVSQIYSAGGNTGATYRNDFIEIHNSGPAPVNVTGWSVQYASNLQTTWNPVPISGIIQPGKYYLVQLGSGGAAGALLPTADASAVINMNSNQGKVAIVMDTAALTNVCPGVPLVDLVGYGGIDCFATGPASSPSVTLSLKRAINGCQNTYNNAADFSTAAVAPRNSASAAVICP